MTKKRIAELQGDLAKGRELLRRIREKREWAEHGLIIMRPYEGTSTVVDANIRHKREDVARFKAEGEREVDGEQQSLLELGL